jgi:hypothetical protein
MKSPVNLDSPTPPSEKKHVWFRGPLLMYLTMVAAFFVIAIFVLAYVIHISSKTI